MTKDLSDVCTNLGYLTYIFQKVLMLRLIKKIKVNMVLLTKFNANKMCRFFKSSKINFRTFFVRPNGRRMAARGGKLVAAAWCGFTRPRWGSAVLGQENFENLM
jgi:hypothetical protein